MPRGDIEFRNVYFNYAEKSETTLKNISFKIPLGKMTAFVGKSGSGKSTIVKLLNWFYKPTNGEITIGGLNIQNIDLEAYWHSIGYVG